MKSESDLESNVNRKMDLEITRQGLTDFIVQHGLLYFHKFTGTEIRDGKQLSVGHENCGPPPPEGWNWLIDESELVNVQLLEFDREEFGPWSVVFLKQGEYGHIGFIHPGEDGDKIMNLFSEHFPHKWCGLK